MHRVCAVLILLLGCLLLAGCGSPAHGHIHVTIVHTLIHRVGLCISTDCGPYAAILNWDVTMPGVTGWYIFANGSQVGGANVPSYTFSGLDCGTTYTFGVQPHDGTGNRGMFASTPYTTPPCPSGATKVGAPSPVGVTCTGSPLNAGANVSTAVSSASPGSTICLNSGAWSAISLSGISPAAPGVTLAATPGQTVSVPGFTLSSDNNLTIEGFYIQNLSRDGIQVFCQVNGGLTITYNTIENLSGHIGIEALAQGCGNNNATQNGVTVSYNQIDHAGGFMEVQGNACGCASADTNWTISHNVMGPGQDLGSSEHYIEGQFVGATIDNNAFLGPTADRDSNLLAHNNVLHCDTTNAPGCQNIQFDNNIIYYADSRAQTLLISDNNLTNIDIENNLDVEDPACATGSPDYNGNFCGSTFVFVERGQQETLLHNTAANQPKSWVMGTCGDGCFVGPTNYNAQWNISSGTPATGNNSYGAWDCTSACTVGNNVGQDGSATSDWGTGAGANVDNWTPSWQNTTWTPNNGSPWSPPPSNYYKPMVGGGVTSSYGWQGGICSTSVTSNCIGP